jgi:hypothetical protein
MKESLLVSLALVYDYIITVCLHPSRLPTLCACVFPCKDTSPIGVGLP